MKALAPLLRRLRSDESAVALIEFAYSLPLLLTLGLGGAEIANYSIATMRVSQLAVSLADNASRAKQDIVAGVPRMREYDVNETFKATQLQSNGLDIKSNGRMILSSLEVNADTGQWIHWQRCYGDAVQYKSSYGKQGDGITGTSFTGMGRTGNKVTAEAGFAVMFAEVVYNYTPLVFDRFVPKTPIRKVAAMYVRDDRDLEKLYNPAPEAPVNSCPA